MVKPQFQDIDVECWEHSDRLGTSRRAICLWHRSAKLGEEILQAVEELLTAAPSANRKLTFRRSQRKRGISVLRLRFVPPQDDLRVMNIARKGNVATIEMTTIGLQVVHDGIQAWCAGNEDFGVSPNRAQLKRKELGLRDKASGELWFWGPTMEP